MDLRRFFEVIFDTREISDDKMRAFSEDHIGRIAANNTSNQYDTMLNDTEAAHNDYFGAIDSEATLFAVQQARTLSVDNAMNAFKKAVSQQEGAVRAFFGKDSPEYQEFFPLGLTEYSSASKLNVESLMTRILNAFTAHTVQLGSGLVTQFTTLKNNYLTARDAQIVKKGEVTASKSATQTSRDTLERQLMKNLLTLSIEFMGDPDRGMDFFDQSIYRRETSSGQLLATITNTIAPNATQSENALPEGSKRLVIQALAGGPIEFGLSVDGVSFSGNTTTVAAPATVEYSIEDFNSAGTILLVRNQNASAAGEYKVEIFG